MIKLKGCQKRIYHIKNIGGNYFDEAYFVLKNDKIQSGGYAQLISDVKKKNLNETDLAQEADIIVREAIDSFSSGRKKGIFSGKCTAFLLGAATSSILIGITAMITILAII